MSAVFATLMRIAKPGQKIFFRSESSGDSPERTGILQELHRDGLVLQTESETEWIPAQEIQAWRLPKQPVPPEIIREQASSTTSFASQEESSFTLPETPKPPSTTSVGHVSAPVDRSLPPPADLELLFAGEPAILLPGPSFSLPKLSRGIQQDLNRWKNRYDYAEKVHEPARVSQDVPRIAELAETLQEPSLFFLAGFLANYSGLGISRAKTYFQNALALDTNHQEAAAAIAAIALKENEWGNAAKFLLWAVCLEGDMDKTNLVRCIGQCVLRLDTTQYPLVGQLLTLDLPETARRLAISLVALAARMDADAYQLALEGDVDKLRQTKIGNELFPRKDDIDSPIAARNTRPDEMMKSTFQETNRRGRVSAYYPGRNFGFIVENSTGQTWFFHKRSIISPSLQQALVDGVVRQDIAFSGKVEIQSGKYPLAVDVSGLSEVAATQADPPKRASLKLRLVAIPKDASAFAKAMEAEQLDQLDRAETLYREEITKCGSHAKSAVKNLAALTNRKGKPEAAIKILEEHRNMFGPAEISSLDQMRVQFYVKARNFLEAADLLSRLARCTPEQTKRVAYQRQEAYCLLANGDFDKSIEKLATLMRANPGDYAGAILLDKAKNAKQTGLIPFDVPSSKCEDEYEDVLSSLALGLSSIAQHHLEGCEQRGIDARTRESGIFTDKDIKQIQNLLDNVKGRRPRERADYLLTLAWLCEHASHVTANRSIHEYLRRYFLALAEATFSDGSPKDIVRCYAVESLVLCPVALEPGREAATSFEMAWTLILGTYLTNSLEPSALLQPEPGKRLRNVERLLDTQPIAWKYIIADSGYYSHRAPVAFHHLQSTLKNDSEIGRVNPRDPGEGDRIKRLESAFATLPSDSLSADRLRQTRESLLKVIPSSPFELDRARIAAFIKILSDAADYALERHFRERETRYLRLDGDIGRFLDELHRHPTHLSFEKLVPALRTFRETVKGDFERAETAKPVLELRNVLDNDFYVLNDRCVALKLLMSSKDESAPPVEAIGLVLEQGNGDPCHSPEPLHGGQSREIELSVIPTKKQIDDGAFTVIIRAEYRTRQGRIEKSQPFSLAVRLGKPSFEEIPNPYSRYAGGSPVEERTMFFGRAALIDRVIRHLSTGTMGQCFVLYGQKRSGKSSVLKQVENRLGGSVLYASISAGTFSPGDLWCSFARLLLQELTFRLEDMGEDIPENWPSRSDVATTPLESIRDVARGLVKRGHQTVVAIDEFTYIFESRQGDVETFMRGWKALLEARTFNALLIGQDTMPRFKQAFPNEFGMTHDERITYLSEEEAKSLARNPILLNGLSRYRGQALHRLFDLTAGSPFFLQIACDRLVRHLNVRKAVFVTEADIDQIARTLTVGSEALPPERFDALVTAAGEKVATIPRDDLWGVLTRVARESLHSGWCYRTALSELPRSHDAVKDLVDREILAVEGDRVRIRVGLFAAWLRANQ